MKTLMKTPLQDLIQGIAQAKSEVELRQPIMARVGCYFEANRWGLMFLDECPTIDENTPDLIKRALSLKHNPVLHYLVQRHAAVHDEVILPPGVWKTICPRSDHGHVMVGPIIHDGHLIGGIAVTRHRDGLAFNADDLADLSALSLHLSTRLTILRSQLADVRPRAENPASAAASPLTQRQTEIAQLVAQGLTNREIGAALWITENSVKQALKRIFRKLEVSSRAELVAALFGKSAIA